jgi:hypothetical protein
MWWQLERESKRSREFRKCCLSSGASTCGSKNTKTRGAKWELEGKLPSPPPPSFFAFYFYFSVFCCEEDNDGNVVMLLSSSSLALHEK